MAGMCGMYSGMCVCESCYLIDSEGEIIGGNRDVGSNAMLDNIFK